MDPMAPQFAGSCNTPLMKGHNLHMRGFISWIVHTWSQKTQYPDGAVLMTGLFPDIWQYFSRKRRGVTFRYREIVSTSPLVRKVPPYPLQQSPHIWHWKNSAGSITVEMLPPLHRTPDGDLVKVLKIAAHRDTGSDARHGDRIGL